MRCGVKAHLNKFEFTVNASENFPDHNGGNVVLKRDWLVKETAELTLQKYHGWFSSYYWWAPVGSGKTVFLKLLGRELQSRGCDVYMTSGNDMDIYPKFYFTNLAKNAGDKTVVLLIDSVHNNLTSKH
jgi:replication-associated recombination protein RarA